MHRVKTPISSLNRCRSIRSCLHHPRRPLVTKITSLFQPTQTLPKELSVKSKDFNSISQRHLIELGFIKPAAPGTFYILPLAQRSLQKIINIIDDELGKIRCQKLILPSLTPDFLWKKTGRLDSMSPELFKLKDRHEHQYILSPTHEESITDLISSIGHISHKQLPFMLYQITNKYRDEMKPRSGLLRAREFLMKDLYTFDASSEDAIKSYHLIRGAYEKIFDRLQVPYVKVLGDSDSMGGSMSEEFHYLAEVGEDHLSICKNCGKGFNAHLGEKDINCSKSGECDFESKKGIEVGHCFVLGTRYSAPLKAHFTNSAGKQEPLVMGCHGLGVSRILAAAVECLSTEEELRWPLHIAPYKVCIIPPKEGSKESEAGVIAEKLGTSLSSVRGLEDEIVLDDRLHLTIGRRCKDASRFGFPFVVVAGRTAACANPTFEIFHTESGEKKL